MGAYLEIKGVDFTSNRYKVVDVISDVAQLSLNTSGFGSTTGSGIYEKGTIVTISAEAVEGSEFIAWSDGVFANPRNLAVDKNLELTAIFAITGNINATDQFTSEVSKTLTGNNVGVKQNIATSSYYSLFKLDVSNYGNYYISFTSTNYTSTAGVAPGWNEYSFVNSSEIIIERRLMDMSDQGSATATPKTVENLVIPPLAKYLYIIYPNDEKRVEWNIPVFSASISQLAQ